MRIRCIRLGGIESASSSPANDPSLHPSRVIDFIVPSTGGSSLNPGLEEENSISSLRRDWNSTGEVVRDVRPGLSLMSN